MIVLHVDFGMGLGEKQCKRQSAERGGGDCGFRIADCGLDGEQETEGGAGTPGLGIFCTAGGGGATELIDVDGGREEGYPC